MGETVGSGLPSKIEDRANGVIDAKVTRELEKKNKAKIDRLAVLKKRYLRKGQEKTFGHLDDRIKRLRGE